MEIAPGSNSQKGEKTTRRGLLKGVGMFGVGAVGGIALEKHENDQERLKKEVHTREESTQTREEQKARKIEVDKQLDVLFLLEVRMSGLVRELPEGKTKDLLNAQLAVLSDGYKCILKGEPFPDSLWGSSTYDLSELYKTGKWSDPRNK